MRDAKEQQTQASGHSNEWIPLPSDPPRAPRERAWVAAALFAAIAAAFAGAAWLSGWDWEAAFVLVGFFGSILMLAVAFGAATLKSKASSEARRPLPASASVPPKAVSASCSTAAGRLSAGSDKVCGVLFVIACAALAYLPLPASKSAFMALLCVMANVAVFGFGAKLWMWKEQGVVGMFVAGLFAVLAAVGLALLDGVFVPMWLGILVLG